MPLKESDILQVNAIVITGILILLTVNADHFANTTLQLGKGLTAIALIMIFPFAASAFIVVSSELAIFGKSDTDVKDKNLYTKRIRFSLIFLKWGFIYLVGFLGFYASVVINSKP